MHTLFNSVIQPVAMLARRQPRVVIGSSGIAFVLAIQASVLLLHGHG